MSFREEKQEKILVAEDDRSLREGLAMSLRMKGYEVLTAGDGDEGMRKVFDERPDLVILDVKMPGYSGLDIVEELRHQGDAVPVLILSALGAPGDKVAGLGLGADDYMGKPFDLAELLARVEVLLRRRRAALEALPTLQFGDLTIERGAREVRRDGRPISLSAREFDLLCLLAGQPGRVFTRENILHRLWGWSYEGTPRTVDNFVRALRRKLEPDPGAPRHIVTVYQAGYRFDP
jgi:two-component system, OmpR family, alkaline phosphatase synthesis response regulator PhoP